MLKLKNIIITTIALLLFGSLVRAQEPPKITPPKITQVKTKSRTYELYKAERGFTIISDANYKTPYLTDIQFTYAHGEEVITLDRNRVLSILKQELASGNIDVGLLHRGKIISINFVLNSIDRNIKIVTFNFDTDFIKDYRVIEKIDNRFRKELVFAPKHDERHMDQIKKLTPVYYISCGISVDKL